MIQTEEKCSARREICSTSAVPSTKPTGNGLWLNQGLCDEGLNNVGKVVSQLNNTTTNLSLQTDVEAEENTDDIILAADSVVKQCSHTEPQRNSFIVIIMLISIHNFNIFVSASIPFLDERCLFLLQYNMRASFGVFASSVLFRRFNSWNPFLFILCYVEYVDCHHL
jgi:hypothetical protein